MPATMPATPVTGEKSPFRADRDTSGNGHGQRTLLPLMKMTFAEFLEYFGEDDDVELIGGVPTQRMAAQYTHERTYGLLYKTLGLVAEDRGLGEVLGSRTPVEIDALHGRLPDVLFVRADRVQIIEEKAVYGAPNLVIEIVSPGDSASHLVELENDYRRVRVPEIVFINPQKQTVRVLRLNEEGQEAGMPPYQEEVIHKIGSLVLHSMGGIRVPVELLFAEPMSTVRSILAAIEQS